MDESRRGVARSRRRFLQGAATGALAAATGQYLLPVEWRAWSLPLGTKVSFGQCGEDLIALELLKALRVDKASYLDIGAYLPILGSNTYMLYRLGGRGVLVEPNVSMIAELKNVRPHDTVLNVGIGFSGDAEADYYVMNYPQLNTFDKDDADRRVKDGGGAVRIDRVVKMPLVDVNRVVAEHFASGSLDFLSVDTEGLDLAILKTFDFSKCRPRVICAETLEPDGVRMMSGIGEFLARHEYAPRGMTFANTLYVDQRVAATS